MALDPVKELGQMLGKMSREQQRLSENITPEDTESQLQLLQSENIELTGTAVFTKKTYASDSFIIDHPVLGIIDSPTLKIDGGYTAGGIPYVASSFSYPGTYVAADEVMATVTF